MTGHVKASLHPTSLKSPSKLSSVKDLKTKILKPIPKKGDKVYGMKRTLHAAWPLGEVVEVIKHSESKVLNVLLSF